MAETEAKIEEVKIDDSKEAKFDDSKEAKVDDSKENYRALSKEQAYRYATMLKPSLKDGVKKAKETGSKAKGDMVGALKWFNSMSSAKQKSLVDMATGAAVMTKDAVAALTETTAREYNRIAAFVAEQGLSNAAQSTAMEAVGKAQQLYSSVRNASSGALTEAKLNGEKVLASESVKATLAWADATRKVVEESEAVTRAKETGGDALKAANESYSLALDYAEQKRVEAVKLTSVYLVAAQEQMVALSESEKGQELQKRTQSLLEQTRQKKAALQERPIVRSATLQLRQSYDMANASVQAAQDWVSAVVKSQSEGKAGEDQIQKQIELVEVLSKSDSSVQE